MDKKRPHILPPMNFPQSFQQAGHSPVEPLKPPSAYLTLDGRLGSPIPQWHRPTSADDNRTPEGNKPGIQVTLCLDNEKSKEDTKQYWARELRKDPQFEDQNLLENPTRTQKSPRLATPAIRQSPMVEVIQGRPKAFYAEKSNFLPKKYAPLKPISRKYVDDDS